MDRLEKEFRKKKRDDNQLKEDHLRFFRPNLANPANKDELAELNEKEIKRSEDYKEMVDNTQLDLQDIETSHSMEFYVAFLNNLRALIKLYDSLLYKEHFIKLPGDEM